MANVTHVSLRDRVSEAPKELYGFIYDIPKDAGVTNADMVALFKEFHIDCMVQIKRDEKKPMYSARVKFMNSVHMRVATEKMRYFKLSAANGNGRQCRFLPYVQSLSKLTDTPVNPEAPTLVGLEKAYSAADALNQSENLPDNSHL